jgi:F-type H+-transporting ATPase subunit gamma
LSSIRDIKRRIKSIQDTRQITNAMKLISSAKLKKARLQLEATLPYFNEVWETIGDILVHMGYEDNPFFDIKHEKQGKKKALLILSGDKGLAGSYNQNILKHAEERLKENPQTTLYVAGNVGRNYFLKKNYRVKTDFDYPVQNPTVPRAKEIAEIILKAFKSGEIDEISLLYTQLITSLKMDTRLIKLLPLDPETFNKNFKFCNESYKFGSIEELIFEPSREVVLDVLVRKYLKGMIYGALVEAFTCEQSARIAAMDNATTNADELLEKLKLEYNSARQAAITQELSEIVAGAGALM